MRDTILGISASVAVFLMTCTSGFADVTVDDFEGESAKWNIPDWALEKQDHVAKKIELTDEVASAGKKSLKVDTAFPGGNWSAAVVELEDYLDFSPAQKIAVDIFLPKDAPEGLKGNIVLTVGDGWTWTEQLKVIDLVPGKWTTVEANIADGSKDWKKTRVDEQWRSDIRKIDIRVISDKKAVYSGPVYIDNIRAIGSATNANPVAK